MALPHSQTIKDLPASAKREALKTIQRLPADATLEDIAYELYFPDFGTTSSGDLLLAGEGSVTQVTWTMNGNMGTNPLFRWMALFGDKMVGADFEAGLANLKALAENP